MAMLTDSWLLDFLSLLTALVVVFVTWIKYSQTYWQRTGIFTPPTSFPFGHGKGLVTQSESVSEFISNLYNYFKKHDQLHGGFYILHTSTYMPVNLDIVKSILQNDFSHFVDRGVYYDETNDPLSAHLFSLEGEKWKNLRAKITPTFTSGRLKMMFDTLVTCGNQLKIEMDKTAGKQAVEMKDMLVRFTTDIIGNCAFGIDCNSLKNPDNEFNQYFKSFFVDTFWENLNGFITFVSPGLAKKLKIKVVKPKLSNFFMKVVKDTIKYREENNIYRKDFMHLLLQLKNRGKLVDDNSVLSEENEKKREVNLTVDEIAAQSFLFFLAGYETSSTTMTFCLFELASNPEVQENLRKEVEEVLQKHDNKLTYEAVTEMHYMEQVINETLRKHPPISTLIRLCTKNYTVPGTNSVIEKGTTVFVPIAGIQHDPEYYPNPEKFDPERFSEVNKKKRHPYAFIPFGEGPRVCIGLRFGMLEAKVGLSVLLKNYKFSINSKTQLPLKFDPTSFTLSPLGGMWLDYTKL
ncbi:probable cytochrome P450 6a13 [Zophobas morio]|uniref:probable cytochrome P450 6a13 n=1 Tax=Zophobas morio TaxID=2755281 RepID=UPI003083B99F